MMIWNSWLIVDDSFQPVFHQPLIFQMFDVFEEFWLVWWCFFSTFWSPVKQSFLFVNDSLGVLLFIICCSFVMSWRTCAILLWCFLVTTLRSLIWDSLLIDGDSFQLLFFISLSSSTLVAFLTWFLLLSGQCVLITVLFHYVHKSSWVFFYIILFEFWRIFDLCGLSWRVCFVFLWCILVITFWWWFEIPGWLSMTRFSLFFISLWYFRCLTFLKNFD